MTTLLPLYTFAKVLGIHPLHFMQVDANIGSAESRVCIHPIMQYSWQDADGVSRQELEYAIAAAEQEIADYLGYWPAPKWVAEERAELPTVLYDMSVKTQYGYLISGGARTKRLILANQAIVYTDTDLDGYKETATISCLTTVTDPEEIHIYYSGGDDDWEIRPIQVSIANGTATIVCRREQLIVRTLLEGLDVRAVSGTTDANFLTAVDVYRVYNDPATQANIRVRSSCSLGCTDGCEVCSYEIVTGCMYIKDKRLGIATVTPGDYDSQYDSYSATYLCDRPLSLDLWYRAGYRDMTLSTPNNTMSSEWQRAVAILAISKLDRIICSCKGVSDVQSHWNTDLRRNVGTQAQSTSLKVTPYELENCPFGTTVAGIEVWRLARRRSLGL